LPAWPRPGAAPRHRAAGRRGAPRRRLLREALAAAQQRADRIGAFRAELAELRKAGVLAVDAAQLRAVESFQENVLDDLVRRFDIDVSRRGKQLSLACGSPR